MNVFENPKNRQGALIVFTGLVAAYVRHGIETHWGSWDSIEQFLTYWFIHTVGLLVLMALVAMAVIYSHKVFLGYARESYGDELTFNILMTVLVASVCIAFLAHWMRIPTIATTHSDGSRPPIPIDRDQCGAGC